MAPALHSQAYLGYMYYLTQHHSLCVWCDETKCKLASVSLLFVQRREGATHFVDLWERRPKAASAKPSKAPSGSPGPCVTLLTKITFSPGPLSLSFPHLLCPLYTLCLFPRQKTEMQPGKPRAVITSSGFQKSLN